MVGGFFYSYNYNFSLKSAGYGHASRSHFLQSKLINLLSKPTKNNQEKTMRKVVWLLGVLSVIFVNIRPANALLTYDFKGFVEGYEEENGHLGIKEGTTMNGFVTFNLDRSPGLSDLDGTAYWAVESLQLNIGQLKVQTRPGGDIQRLVFIKNNVENQDEITTLELGTPRFYSHPKQSGNLDNVFINFVGPTDILSNESISNLNNLDLFPNRTFFLSNGGSEGSNIHKTIFNIDGRIQTITKRPNTPEVPVPEPTSMALSGLGLLGFAGFKKLKNYFKS
jgi:hypothetical protein